MARGQPAITEVVGDTLVYRPIDRSSTSSSEAAFFKLITFPILAATALAVGVGPEAGLGGFVVSVGYLLWRRSKQKNPPGLRLSVDAHAHALDVRDAAGKSLLRIELDELLDVALDTKTIERVQEGSALIPGTRFIDSKVGPEVDTARVVIVGTRSRSVPLTDEYLAHMDATEALGKIRVFLRKAGWVPQDERDEAPPSSVSA